MPSTPFFIRKLIRCIWTLPREALNTDARENHSLSEPVVVRIYQLKDRQTFDRLVYQQLLEEGIFCSPPISSPVAMW
jgi:type VI secretion system protein VasD